MQPSNLADSADVGSRFRDAVYTGNRSELEHLIDLYGLSSSEGLCNGYVLLCDAIRSNHLEIAKLLLTSGSKTEIGADCLHHLTNLQRAVSFADAPLKRPLQLMGWKYAPLHLAVAKNNLELVGLLLESGADVDVKGSDDETPLHVAVRYGHVRIAEDLLTYKACVNSLNLDGNTPLHILCKGNKGDFGLGCRDNDEELAEILIQHGADVNLCNILGDSPIICAIKDYNYKLFSLLLNREVNISNNPRLLNVAVDNIDIVTTLLQHGSNVNACDSYGYTALHCASYFVWRKEPKGEPDTEMENMRLRVIQLLLSMGANVNAKDKYNSTPLHEATKTMATDVVKVLLDMNADVNVKDEYLHTPIYYALFFRNKEIIKLLLGKGARVNEKFEDGLTLLHEAAKTFWSLEMNYCFPHPDHFYSQVFKDRGILVERLKDECRKQKEREWIISSLLEQGTDVNILSNANRTALAEASETFFLSSFCGKGYLGARGLLTKHLYKMKIANLYLNKGNLLAYKDVQLEKKCRYEISIMSNELFLKVDDVNISYYDILTKNASTLARYLRFEHAEDFFNVYTKFPLYARLLKINFFKCILFVAGINFINQIYPKLPYDCIDVILSYLSCDDLKVFVSEAMLLNFLNSPGVVLD